MKLSVAIMAHPRRSTYVEELRGQLGRDVPVVWDRNNDRYDTGRAAVLACDPGATHHLVLQDDAILCRDFLAAAERAAEVVPDEPISFFYSHGSNQAHQRTNQIARTTRMPSWVRFEGPWWGVAVMFPTELIPEMVRHADAPRATRAYDKRLSLALRRMNVACHYVLPSLVDHRLDGPSMIEGREQEDRRAIAFIGREKSGLSLPWDRMPVREAFRGRPIKRRAPSVRSVPIQKVPSTGQVSIAVSAHPRRRHYVGPLLERLGIPEEHVVWDEQDHLWDTARRSLLAYDPNAAYHVVVQDDALPCRGFVESLPRVLSAAQGHPVGLYVGTVRPVYRSVSIRMAAARASGSPWFAAGGPYWGVAMAIPSGDVEELVAFGDTRQMRTGYDSRVAQFFARSHRRAWYTLPSLVDHRSGPSLVPGRKDAGRRAVHFIGEESSPEHLDWSRVPVRPESGYVSGPGGFACWDCERSAPREEAMQRHVRRHVRSV